MILSVSRRTDIPAFYSDWFFKRLKEGCLLVRNPMNIYQVSRINLSPEVIDCIVFWTKDPTPMMDRLDLLKDYHYYFQFTLNSYDQTVEKNVPKKKDLIKTFIKLSETIGAHRVIWRYDPILLTDKYNKEYHYKYFDYIANKLKNYTPKCVISFLDLYSKTEKNLKSVQLLPISQDDMEEIASNLAAIAKRHNIKIETCSEIINLFRLGIEHGKCIDDKLISEIIGIPLAIEKDKNQRESCGCVSSIDIGAYNTCKHNCLYCYANFSKPTVDKNCLEHDKNSPLLIGQIGPKDKITDREMKSFIPKQAELFG